MVFRHAVIELEEPLCGEETSEVGVVHQKVHKVGLVLYECGQQNVL